MWSHYSNFHKGFCIGFSVKNLLDSLIFGKIGKVEYTMNYPKIKPRIAKKDDQLMSNLFTQTYTKASDWKYEKEYRFMLNTFPKEFTPKNRIVTVPDNFFSEVILGISISKADKNQILDICKKKGIPVFQAQKEIKRFKISREEIKN
jgi:hypothetical protein